MDSKDRFSMHLQRVNSVFTGATKVAGIGLAAIVILVVTTVAPIMSEVHTNIEAQRALKANLKEQIDTDKDLRKNRKETAVTKYAEAEEAAKGEMWLDFLGVPPEATGSGEETVSEQKFDDLQKSVAQADELLDGSHEAIDQTRDALTGLESKRMEPVQLEFFNLKMKVPAALAPVALSGITLALLIYLYMQRRLAMRELCRALHIARRDLKIRARKLDGLLFTPPIWILPLPRQVQPALARPYIVAALGWHKKEFHWMAGTLLIMAGLTVLQLYLTFGVIEMALLTPHFLLKWSGFVLSSTFLAATIYVMIGPFIDEQPFRYREIAKSPAVSMGISRRRLLKATGCMALAIFSYGALAQSGLERIAARLSTRRQKPTKNPRYVQTGLAAGFVRSGKSETVHYVDAAQRLVGVQAMDIATLGLVNLDELPKPSQDRRLKEWQDDRRNVRIEHINWFAYSRAVEQTVLKLAKELDYQRAIQVLWVGVYHDQARPTPQRNYRIYDLLAVLSLRHRLVSLKELRKVCQVDEDEVLRARAKKWSKSKWQSKWAADTECSWNEVAV